MAQVTPLRITMSARPVVAIGQPFAPWGVEFSDAGIARDEISALRAGAEPLVLRVRAVGGAKVERELVAGDWLCDSDGEEARRVPKPHWFYGFDSQEWAAKRLWLDAWEEYDSPMAMLHQAAATRTGDVESSLGVPRRFLVGAACACVEAMFEERRGSYPEARAAVAVARSWTRGAATTDDVTDARAALQIDRSSWESHRATQAAGDTLLAVTNPNGAAGAAFWANDAVLYMTYRGDLRDRASLDRHRESGRSASPFLARCADLVRREIPTVEALRSAIAWNIIAEFKRPRSR